MRFQIGVSRLDCSQWNHPHAGLSEQPSPSPGGSRHRWCAALGFEDVEHFPLDSGPEAPLEVIGVGEDPQQKRGVGTD